MTTPATPPLGGCPLGASLAVTPGEACAYFDYLDHFSPRPDQAREQPLEAL